MEVIELPDFGLISDEIRRHAKVAPQRPALICGTHQLSYGEFDRSIDRVAASLQRDGLRPGDSIAICAIASVVYAVVFLGALRAGVVVAPLAPGSTAAGLARMVADADAKLVFVDGATAGEFAAFAAGKPHGAARYLNLDDHVGRDGNTRFSDWLAPAGAVPTDVPLVPSAPFNIIYSSGTTGEPKGIVQPHAMRWSHVRRGRSYGYGPQSITLLATPLYSNTTLVVFFPTLAFGGTVVLMPKFDAIGYLQLAERLRVTHTMLVPVQYQRLMAHVDFERYDLRGFQMKFSTSAPFGAALKADVLRRWPGGLIEFYGMTEGGGTCILEAHRHPDKLHTVGLPAQGHDIRLIDDEGRGVAAGASGEVVGHSSGMMNGYHGQPEKTREAEWFAPDGKRFIRTGDVGRFDEDGFLILFDRKKDMIISGGFNIYPSDLEAQLRLHPSVAEAAVVGVPSQQWGETPVAFVVLKPGAAEPVHELKDWFNSQVGKTQRLAALVQLAELPRSAIGKVLKRDLRAAYAADRSASSAKPAGHA
ncbi:MAG: class I adenylate-forming enzyme family protein [Ideonella sp.]